MRDITPDQILNSLLIDWRKYQLEAPINGTDRPADPTFRDVHTASCWEAAEENFDKKRHAETMKAMEFAIEGDEKGQGGLKQEQRYAIREQAMNLHTGVFVWRNPRLPVDPMERAILLQEARNALMRRLIAAGVM